MSRSNCLAEIEPELLTQYWLGELDASREAQFEEHLFGCNDCTARLQELVGIADGIRALRQNGSMQGVVSKNLLDRLAGEGLRLREYAVAEGGSVNCTVAPDDDLVISRLHASLAGITCLDLVLSDEEGAEQLHLHDIPFNADAGEIIFIPSMAYLRTLPAATLRMQLLSVDTASPVQVGEYTFMHTPWPPT